MNTDKLLKWIEEEKIHLQTKTSQSQDDQAFIDGNIGMLDRIKVQLNSLIAESKPERQFEETDDQRKKLIEDFYALEMKIIEEASKFQGSIMLDLFLDWQAKRDELNKNHYAWWENLCHKLESASEQIKPEKTAEGYYKEANHILEGECWRKYGQTLDTLLTIDDGNRQYSISGTIRPVILGAMQLYFEQGKRVEIELPNYEIMNIEECKYKIAEKYEYKSWDKLIETIIHGNHNQGKLNEINSLIKEATKLFSSQFKNSNRSDINSGDTFEKLFQRHKTFAFKTFTKSTPESSLKGLEREIDEIRKETDRKKKGIEYVDCFFYLLDSYNRAGFAFDELKHFMTEKLSINENRGWDKNEDNSYSHKK